MTPFAASDSQPVDDSMQSADMPESMGDGMDSEIETQTALNIPADIAELSGLTDLSPGDKFTVTIKGRIIGNDPATGVRADVTSAADGMKDDSPDMEEQEPETEGFEPPASKIEMGPGKDFKG